MTGHAQLQLAASAIGVDAIADFSSMDDHIVLDKTTFMALTSQPGEGFTTPTEFDSTAMRDDLADNSNAFIVYNSMNGHLFYNQNGVAEGFGTGAQFATLTSAPALTAMDFIIQA